MNMSGKAIWVTLLVASGLGLLFGLANSPRIAEPEPATTVNAVANTVTVEIIAVNATQDPE